MKRTALALTFILALLLSSLVGTQVVKVAKANWLGPLPDPTPTISVQTPRNGSRYFQDQISLTFSVKVTLGSSQQLSYKLDSQAIVVIWEQNNAKGEYSVPIQIPSDGWHMLTVWAIAENLQGASGNDKAAITFLVDIVPPSITVLSPQNKTYMETDVPLDFTVSEVTKWIGYSLDGEANTTTDGNTTLTDLPEGYHNLKVYANDTVGRFGSSETSYFNISQQTEPPPTDITPTGSNPILLPNPNPKWELPNTWIMVGIVVFAIVLGAGLLVYFKKRKH